MNDCKNCARALTRLMASREKPGPSPGEMQHCPECGDRRWVVPITVASWLEGEDSDGRTLGWTEAQPTTTFTVPAGDCVPKCHCGRYPSFTSKFYTDGQHFGVYECEHTGPIACSCQRCEHERGEWGRTFCSCSCGNKRCPHSQDHRYECTGSNEPDQVGVLK